jgi:Nucleotide exchange factor Fes1
MDYSIGAPNTQACFSFLIDLIDGTKATTEFKPMKQEDLEWLMKAIESQGANSEAIRMKEIAALLKREDLDKDEENTKLDALDELLDLVEGPRNSLGKKFLE